MPSATWKAIKKFRGCRDFDPPTAFGAAFKLWFRWTRVTCNAGIIPKNKALRRETARLTVKTRASTCRYVPLGTIPDVALVMISSHHRATTKPSVPPQSNRSALSVRSCRIMRAREQPRAARTAISRWRFTPRARSKLATFAQAIRRTSPAAPAIIHKPRRAFCFVGPGCRNSSVKFSTTRCPLRSAGARGPRSCCEITSVSERTRSNVTPGLRRATIRTLTIPALSFPWLR